MRSKVLGRCQQRRKVRGHRSSKSKHMSQTAFISGPTDYFKTHYEQPISVAITTGHQLNKYTIDQGVER